MPATGPSAWNTPDAFVGRGGLSAYVPYPVVTASAYSSNDPASVLYIPWHQPQNLTLKNIYLPISMSVTTPQASSQASTGSNGYTYANTAYLFARQDFGANSSNLSFLTSGSGGISASVGYSSTSVVVGLSWLTDSTGGVGSFTTSTNAAANQTRWFTGAKLFQIPLVTTLTAGEYWLGFQVSSTTASSVSDVTMLSVSQMQVSQPVAAAAMIPFGSSVVAGFPRWLAAGSGTGVTTSTTMAMSAVTAVSGAPAPRVLYFELSNA